MLHFCSKNESKHVGEQQEFLFIKQIKEHKKNVYTDSLFDATMIKRKTQKKLNNAEITTDH